MDTHVMLSENFLHDYVSNRQDSSNWDRDVQPSLFGLLAVFGACVYVKHMAVVMSRW